MSRNLVMLFMNGFVKFNYAMLSYTRLKGGVHSDIYLIDI